MQRHPRLAILARIFGSFAPTAMRALH